MPTGSMLAIPLGEQECEAFLGPGGEVDLAAVNGANSCVVAGPTDAIEALRAALAEKQVSVQLLHTSHAFHSRLLDPAVRRLRDALDEVDLHSPIRPYISSVTGAPITAEQAVDRDYWAAQLRRPVRFADAVGTAVGDGSAVLLEVGPGQALTSAVRRELGRTVTAVATLPRVGSPASQLKHVADATGHLWVAGVDVDWSALHRGRRRRVPLPTYPYERTRYWVDPDEDDVAPSGPVLSGPVHIPVFRRRPTAATGDATVGGPWLVLQDGSSVIDDVLRRLATAGERVAVAVPGDAFGERPDGSFTVRPGERDDHDALLAAVEDRYGRPTRILHAWTDSAATRADNGSATADDTDAIAERGFYGLLAPLQAVQDRWAGADFDVRVVTNGLWNVTGVESVRPAAALLLGPARVVPIEHPNIRCQVIDLGRPGRVVARTASALWDELQTPVIDTSVALRAGRRWVQEYEAVDLSAQVALPVSLRRRGVYVITGGLGGLGLEKLVESTGARVALLNRTGLPPRDKWAAHLAQAPDDVLAHRIRAVRDLEQSGGDVMVVVADVADETSAGAALDEVRERFGRIDGIFHLAGEMGGGLAALRSREACDRVLTPKVAGIRVLDRLLGNEVSLMVLFSSISVVTGDYGLVDYVSANAYLDAFAQSRATHEVRTLAVDWCGWAGQGMVDRSRQSAPAAFRAMQVGIDGSPATDAAEPPSTPEPAELRYEPVAHPLLGRRVHGIDDAGTSDRKRKCAQQLQSDELRRGLSAVGRTAISSTFIIWIRPGASRPDPNSYF